MKTFSKCAERYLRMWCDPVRPGRFKDTDETFVRQFQRGVTCEELGRFFVCYAVARTIPGKDHEGYERYQPFRDMLEQHRNIEIVPEAMPGFIQTRVDEMAKQYGRRLLSAVTKAFWMLKQHPIIIYDSKASRGLRRHALQPGSGDYGRYVKSWRQFSELPKIKHELTEALAVLPESRLSGSLEERGIATKDEIRSLSRKPWFSDRVVDMYLVLRGH